MSSAHALLQIRISALKENVNKYETNCQKQHYVLIWTSFEKGKNKEGAKNLTNRFVNFPQKCNYVCKLKCM